MAAAGNTRSCHRQAVIPLEARHRARGGVCSCCPSADAVVGPRARRRWRRLRRFPLLFCSHLPSGWRAGGTAGRPRVGTFPPLAALGWRPRVAPVRPDGGGPSPPRHAAAHAGGRTCAHAVRGRSRWSYLGRSRGDAVGIRAPSHTVRASEAQGRAPAAGAPAPRATGQGGDASVPRRPPGGGSLPLPSWCAVGRPDGRGRLENAVLPPPRSPFSPPRHWRRVSAAASGRGSGGTRGGAGRGGRRGLGWARSPPPPLRCLTPLVTSRIHACHGPGRVAARSRPRPSRTPPAPRPPDPLNPTTGSQVGRPVSGGLCG